MTLFAFLSPMQLLVLGGLGVLIFGRKLPELGKYLGQTIVQFRKGMNGLEDDIGGVMAPNAYNPAPCAGASAQAPVEQIRAPQRVAATAPKFQDAPANPPQV